MVSARAREKAKMQGHGRRWNAMAVVATDILSEYAPLRLEWPPSLVPKFARIAKAKATAQLSVRAKAEGNTLSQARARVKIDTKAMARADSAKDMKARAMGKAHLAAGLFSDFGPGSIDGYSGI